MTRTQIHETIFGLLYEMEKNNFRNGFENTVLHKVCNKLREFDWQLGDRFWNLYLSKQYNILIDEYFDGYKMSFVYFQAISEIAAGKGSFVMPEWGTYGT